MNNWYSETIPVDLKKKSSNNYCIACNAALGKVLISCQGANLAFS